MVSLIHNETITVSNSYYKLNGLYKKKYTKSEVHKIVDYAVMRSLK